MSELKAKMHKIQFLLGLRSRTRCGSLQRSPDPLAEFKGSTSKGREGEKLWNGREKGKGRRGKERGKEEEEGTGGRNEKGRSAYRDEGPLTKILNTPLVVVFVPHLRSRDPNRKHLARRWRRSVVRRCDRARG